MKGLNALARQGISPPEVCFLNSLWRIHNVALPSFVLLREMDQLQEIARRPLLQKPCYSHNLHYAPSPESIRKSN